MGNISSINFKKSFAINTQHNDRTKKPSYLLANGKFECNRTSEQAEILKNEIIEQAKINYAKTKRQKFQAKSFEWSAVVNIKSNTTMKDLENLANILEKNYGFQCYQIAIHRDEGHIVDDKQVLNEHAHLEFITLDKHTGINRQRELTPKKLRELQTLVADVLQMKRGVDKRISKTKRIEPRQWAKLKEEEKQKLRKQKAKYDVLLEKSAFKNLQLELEVGALEVQNQNLKDDLWVEKENNAHLHFEIENLSSDIYNLLEEREEENKHNQNLINIMQDSYEQEVLKVSEIKQEFENFRKEQINKGFSKEFFRELSEEKKKQLLKPTYTREQLINFFNNHLKKYNHKPESLKDYNNLVMYLNEQNATLKQFLYKSDEYIKEEVENALNLQVIILNDEIKTLEQENEILKQENNHLKNLLHKANKYKTILKQRIKNLLKSLRVFKPKPLKEQKIKITQEPEQEEQEIYSQYKRTFRF